MLIIESMLSLVIWKDLRLAILSWVNWLLGISSLKWHTVWSISLPRFLGRVGVLLIIEGMLSLIVWKDFRLAVLSWVNWVLGPEMVDIGVSQWHTVWSIGLP